MSNATVASIMVCYVISFLLGFACALATVGFKMRKRAEGMEARLRKHLEMMRNG